MDIAWIRRIFLDVPAPTEGAPKGRQVPDCMMNTASKQHIPGPLQPSGNKCAECRFSAMCVPGGLDPDGSAMLDSIVKRHRILRDARLYRIGQPFTSLYAIHFGHLKTTQVDRRGAQQVTGFAMSGDVLGFDAIAGGRHVCDAVALEDSEVCEIPFDRLQELFCKHPQLLQRFHFLMSQEIQREQAVMLVLGNLRAEQRFACFLLNLSSRYAQRGYSPTSFQLRMSRDDIGGYLGLTIESVSRLVAKFRNAGWIRLDNRKLDILDRASLEALAAEIKQKTGIVADPALGGQGWIDYTAAVAVAGEYDMGGQVITQIKAVAVTLLWSGIGSAILFILIDKTLGLRPSEDAEREGLDLSSHGERAYNY